jgi:hypothetical protein
MWRNFENQGLEKILWTLQKHEAQVLMKEQEFIIGVDNPEGDPEAE